VPPYASCFLNPQEKHQHILTHSIERRPRSPDTQEATFSLAPVRGGVCTLVHHVYPLQKRSQPIPNPRIKQSKDKRSPKFTRKDPNRFHTLGYKQSKDKRSPKFTRKDPNRFQTLGYKKSKDKRSPSYKKRSQPIPNAWIQAKRRQANTLECKTLKPQNPKT
jgi:hypothetical protein